MPRANGTAAMTFWNAHRDTRLQRLERRGLSASQIAGMLATTRNAVLGRSVRLRGLVFPSVLEARAARKAESAARRAARERATAKVLRSMRHNLSGGMAREAAIRRAVCAGATYQAVGAELGITRQRCHQLAARAR
jgi:hypothetical protein